MAIIKVAQMCELPFFFFFAGTSDYFPSLLEALSKSVLFMKERFWALNQAMSPRSRLYKTVKVLLYK
jgi:hypothetical protein